MDYIWYHPNVYDKLKREGKLPANARRIEPLPATRGPSYIVTKI